VEVIESIENTLPPVDLIKEVDSAIFSQITRTSQPRKSISPPPPPATTLQLINQTSKEKPVNEPILVNDEIAEEYNSYLLNERNEILREKQANERLSHSLESHVIEDAQVNSKIIITNQ
jgi:hypothetical protein